jgi:type VI secretion system secreted protein VgrG
MKLKTVLGDALKFRSLAATEELGRLYDFSVLALSDAGNEVDTAALLGTDAVVTVTLGDDSKRHFHGIVTRAGLESASGKKIGWRLQLRPWLWKLTRRADSRIFQNMTVEAILKQVFQHYPGGDVVFELQGSYTPRLYCVQYRETDFNFASRLMEEEGIYYFHRHTENKHTLVICDAMTSHADWPGYSTLKFRESQDQLVELEAITDWRHTHELTPGKVTLNEYDFLKPATPLKVDHSSVHKSAPAALEQYDYPGLYTEKSRGANLARVRQQELDARVLRISGFTSTIGAVATGYRFTLEDHPLKKENTDHVVIATRIDAQYAGYESGQGEMQFSCRFQAMRYAHIFRPERSTPRPVIAGPQTAVVVGPAGEEIFTDSHGRVKVQFHWDREGKKDDQSSCWLRVSSAWAGKAWGAISLPRIGQEVVVDFLEGDPDQPLVTGRVYNAVNVPPYALPDNKTVSTIKSQSSIGGTTANANEFRFQDKKGKEHIWLQAERHLRTLVKDSAWTEIKKNKHHIVGGGLTESVGGDHQWTVKGTVRGKTEGDQFHETGGSLWLQSADYMIRTGDVMWKSGDSKFDMQNLELKCGMAAKIKAGMKLSLKATMIAIEADVQLSLKVGGNFVDISPAGVSINGTLVLINSGGAAGSADAAGAVAIGSLPAPELPGAPRDPLTPAA